MKLQFLFVLLMVMAACSGGGSDSSSVSGKNLHIAVSGSRSFNPDIVHGEIDYYQITISADDLEDPIVEKFDGDAENAKMLGIPSGESRTILVEAVNPNGLVIRRGKKEGVSIYPGKTTAIEIAMNSVPIFTNIADKSAVSGNRITFEVFGEPESQLEIVNMTNGLRKPVVDAVSGSARINTTSNPEGLYFVDPGELDYGTYSFQVKDLETGEYSRVDMTLYKRTSRPGVMVTSTGEVKKIGDELIYSSTGFPFHQEVTTGTFLDIVVNIY